MIPENVRPQLKAAMLQSGVPAGLAERAADLAMHAANEALASFDRCVIHLEGNEWGLTYQIALQILAAQTEAMHKQFVQTMRENGVPPSPGFLVEARG
ncbi:hypothetical protein [Novosphingobium colocasiae]|uniref:hypothetical protein n=1 Tax=Novosphingobium colocasiae TaxID=1256513 RepID=UPI0035AF977E